MHKVRHLVLFIGLSLPFLVSGQDIDSLEAVADTLSDNKEKAELSWSLVVHFDSTGRPAETLRNAKIALNAAQKERKTLLEAKAYLQLAKSSAALGRQADAVEYLRLYSLVSAEVQSEARVEDLESELESLQNSQRALENYTRSLEDLLDSERQQNLSNKLYASNYFNYLVAAIVALGIFTVVFIFLQVRAGKRVRDALNRNSETLNDLAVERDELKEEVAGLKQTLASNTRAGNVSGVLAQRIQSEFLDHSALFEKTFPNSFRFSRAREVASGDYLWVGKQKGKTMLLLIDTGLHGVGSTYLILLINQLMKRLTEEEISAPTMILTMLDQHIRSKISISGAEDFYGLKAAALTFEKSSGEVQVSSALLPVYMVQKGDLKVIEGDQQPIGGLAEGEKFFETVIEHVQPKDFIYLFTDGFEDQLGGKSIHRFTRPSIRKLINSISNQKLEEQSFMIEKVFNDWRRSQPQTDDVTVVGIRL